MDIRKLGAEFLGTMWLVLGGCGAAVLAAGVPGLGIGNEGVALAFGLTVVTAAYAFSGVSGAHFNPAVTIGVWLGGRCPTKDVAPYILAQLLGGVLGASVLYIIAAGVSGFDPHAGFASNGYGEHSPQGYSMVSAIVAEAVLSFVFLLVILRSTSAGQPAGFGPLAIGLCLTLIHLISIPVDNTSVNPARSTAVAIFQGGWALQQLWLFWAAPIAGAALGGIVNKWLFGKD